MLQRYADLVIAPLQTLWLQPGQQLDAQRLAAAQEVICAAVAMGRPAFALNLAQMAGSAPHELPFVFTELDAWRLAVDAQHCAAKNQWVAA
ncbi:hypothetical protein [Stutzerimonas nitrititolerans]|uniref:hypothetical protein n=1 Tax=Stutzerimonas nitrititolerans TaxID=2482751 RepID=UPI0028AEF836|nr:hypothetical protein [Stutzerimonas nitrititolerans]